jgi:predicted O-methyltransferase YrrM
MDVVFGAVISGGKDPWNSAHKKIGGTAHTEALTIDQQAEYIRPFVGTIHKHIGLRGVILHDCLSDELVNKLQTEFLKFEKVPVQPTANNYEGRFFAFRNYLTLHSNIQRCWFIDISDVAFAVDPFAWWTQLHPPEDAVLVGEEWVKYNDNPWFGHQLAYLPPEYKQFIIDEHGETFPLNCGVWGASRLTAMTVLDRMCEHMVAIHDYWKDYPPPYPIMIDMFAFCYVLLKHYPTRLLPFKMDPDQCRYGMDSPVIHDRQRALKCIEGAGGVGYYQLPPDLAAQLHFTYTLEGWCPPDKAEAMAALVLRVKPQLVVEIGVFGGRSYVPQALALKHNGKGVIYGIDPWTVQAALEGGCDDEKWWKTVDLSGHYCKFMTAVTAMGLWHHCRVIAAPSETVVETFSFESIDVLHIDGNHSEAVSSRDVHMYLSRVKVGGHVWFDDTNWKTTRQAVQMVEEKCELVQDYKTFRLYKKVRA